ncbi:hypothetical protein [Actinocorallia longicatena]|uniref:Uncharacterized protein n=1 Tax=Actinocorallia longicatena TaxID=111803 RepID=A0ABP6QII5_9ACTN
MGEHKIWSTIRLLTSLVAGSAALGYLLIALRGIIDIPFELAPAAARQSVVGPTADTVPPASGGHGPGFPSLAVPLTIAAVLLAGLLLAIGCVAGLRAFRSQRRWARGQRFTLAGGVAGALVIWAGPAVSGNGWAEIFENWHLPVAYAVTLAVLITVTALFGPRDRDADGVEDSGKLMTAS